MANPRKAFLVGVSLACVLLASTGFATPVAARDVLYTLYGSTSGGWGYTNTSLAIPGPHLTVVQGDNVTFTLISVDGNRHNWFIDYNNNSRDDASDPNSPNFQTGSITWNFTANVNGTFKYYSRFDIGTMWGNITVLPPGSTPPGTAGDMTVLVVVGAVAIVVAVLAAAAMFSRRLRTPPPPPPED